MHQNLICASVGSDGLDFLIYQFEFSSFSYILETVRIFGKQCSATELLRVICSGGATASTLLDVSAVGAFRDKVRIIMTQAKSVKLF